MMGNTLQDQFDLLGLTFFPSSPEVIATCRPTQLSEFTYTYRGLIKRAHRILTCTPTINAQRKQRTNIDLLTDIAYFINTRSFVQRCNNSLHTLSCRDVDLLAFWGTTESGFHFITTCCDTCEIPQYNHSYLPAINKRIYQQSQPLNTAQLLVKRGRCVAECMSGGMSNTVTQFVGTGLCETVADLSGQLWLSSHLNDNDQFEDPQQLALATTYYIEALTALINSPEL